MNIYLKKDYLLPTGRYCEIFSNLMFGICIQVLRYFNSVYALFTTSPASSKERGARNTLELLSPVRHHAVVEVE